MDEQDKELDEILRIFDKAPSPSSERNNQAQMRQNNLQSRQISQSQLTPNGLSAHQIKLHTKDNLSQVKSGISRLNAKPQ